MIIGCPNCETKYNLPDDKIPPEGRKVKCSQCGHVFKSAPPPPEVPEDAVEDLLEEGGPAPDEDTDQDFDAAFEEAVASQDEDSGDEPAPPDEEDALDEEEDDGLAAAFDEEEEDEEEDSGLLEDDDEDLLADQDDDEEDLLADQEEDSSLLADEEEDELDITPSAEQEESLFPLDGEEDGLDLDGGKKSKKKRKEKGGKKKSRPLLLLFILLLLMAVAAVATFNVGLWNERDFMSDPPLVELPFELPIKVPFLRGPQAPEPAEPGEPPTERIKYIQPVDFRQYIITNEKAGPVFVVEGKALNKFTTPKERIKVRVTLFDAAGNVLSAQEQLCGNTLSLFQLQVQSEQEIVEALNSQAGIYANNTYIKPGDTTPFMVVFFNPPEEVEEYQIKIVDARDPAQ